MVNSIKQLQRTDKKHYLEALQQLKLKAKNGLLEKHQLQLILRKIEEDPLRFQIKGKENALIKNLLIKTNRFLRKRHIQTEIINI